MINKKIALLLCVFLSAVGLGIAYAQVQSNYDDHTLIVVLSPPRSLSTVFLCMMEGRGDCKVVSEPGVDAYTIQYAPEFAEDMCDPSTPKTFHDAQQLILSLYKQHKLVVVKEMGYAAQKYLLDGELGQLIKKKAHVLFLIRDPHETVISFYKKLPQTFDLLPSWLSYRELYELYQKLHEEAKNKPHIILVNDLIIDPFKTVKRFFDAAEIDFNQKYLSWKPLDGRMGPNHPWNNDVCKFWYGRALASHCFEKQTTYECTPQGEPTFQEVANAHDKAFLFDIYRDNLPYYALFIKAAEMQKKEANER